MRDARTSAGWRGCARARRRRRESSFCERSACRSRRTASTTIGRGSPVSPSDCRTLSTDGIARRRDGFMRRLGCNRRSLASCGSMLQTRRPSIERHEQRRAKVGGEGRNRTYPPTQSVGATILKTVTTTRHVSLSGPILTRSSRSLRNCARGIGIDCGLVIRSAMTHARS